MRDLMLETSRPAAGLLTVTSPYDGRELDQVATSGVDHVDDALTAAHSLFRDRNSWLSIPGRLEILNGAAEIMRSQVEELTLLAASEGGKHIRATLFLSVRLRPRPDESHSRRKSRLVSSLPSAHSITRSI
jgi:acyl-CoA reductase-like NAD-dependent aldehyde dehydrogenase